MEQLEQENFISSIHQALNTYPVMVYNGQEFPVCKPLPQALTHISEDVRAVKKNVITVTDTVNEQNLLLQGLKRRRQIKQYFLKMIVSIDESFKVSKVYKLIVGIVGAYVAYNGIVKIIEEITKWLS